MSAPQILTTGLALYLLAGAFVALPFLFVGAPRLLPGAKGSSLAFRLLILPGAIALWPVVLRRWTAGAPEEGEKEAAR